MFFINYIYILSYLILIDFFSCGVIRSYWKQLFSALLTVLFVCCMQMNCLYAIVKVLASCEKLPIVKFEPIVKFNLDIKPSDFSTKRMCLYEIYVALVRYRVSGRELTVTSKFHIRSVR